MVSVIRKKKVKCIIGYSSAIGELGRYIEKYHVDTKGFCVKAILPISESMPGEVRRNLEKIFRCTVRSWYSNEENGIMGLQREEDESYYIDTESYYYEILKLDSDEPAEPGELGRIVITDLYNYAIPLIRYDNGDLAVAERKEKRRTFPPVSEGAVWTAGRYDLRLQGTDRFSFCASERPFHGERDRPVPFHSGG